MPIFTINGAKLDLISELPFNLEMDIQRLVERHLKTIFGLEFITSEFILDDLRIDSLAYDEESSSFVIIEYKRDKNFSVIDQGLAYLATLLKNKAEFILLYNEKTSKSIRKEKVDWSQSRVIFIAPFYTTYQRKAIEFKDFPIELWEIKKYSNSTILFNQVQAPQKGESITKIGQSSEIVRSISREIVTYTEEYQLEKCDSRIKDVYKELKDLILSLSPEITMKVTKGYIAFVHKKNFVSIRTKRTWLLVHLALKKGELNDPKGITLGTPNTEGHYDVTHFALRVNDKSDLGYVLTLIKQAYDKN